MSFPDFDPTVPVFLRTLAARHGAKTLIALDEKRLSYADAETRSARLARGLLARGVGKGARVAILMPNGPDWVVAWLAVSRIGAIAVPLNTFFQARELGWLLRHADVDTLLAVPRFLSHDYLERLEQISPQLDGSAPGAPLRLPELPFLRRAVVFGEPGRAWTESGEALIASAGGDPALDDDFLRAVEAGVTPADAMIILYSSGSTADPKGAVHTHGSVLRHSHNLVSSRDVKSDDVIWSPMPFFWVGGFVFSFLGGMHVGATMVVEEVFEPERTLRFLERERVTIAAGWPHFGKALADHPTRPARDLSALRAGNLPDVMPEHVVPRDPQRRPNSLGMTETCGPHTWGQEGGALPDALRGSFGTAVPGVSHRVVDPASGELLPPGVPGEICVRGYSLMQGLYKVERESVFEPDGFYRTGDAGYFDANGVLFFQGRLGDMIKTGGANVTPSEVEALLVSFPEVKAAYVVGVPDAERGQSVAASVLLEPGVSADPEELRARVKGQIAAYKVPRHLFIDADGALPFTDSGKIDKRRLAHLLAERIAG
jgi:acyl-CoA synthetase (AMP-forming)/AMP-acid ligase II